MRQLAVTVGRSWPEIKAFIDTGHSNAKSEGVNRVIKLVAHATFGLRNAENQRLRTRCVTTRRARGRLRTAQLRRNPVSPGWRPWPGPAAPMHES
ncbi:transposase [Streptomyces incanus]|uniref:Transposase n=1 Tax=Streptomyces incanus TaxID=887453 RepID=A0ABW0XUG0_9ACTN